MSQWDSPELKVVGEVFIWMKKESDSSDTKLSRCEWGYSPSHAVGLQAPASTRENKNNGHNRSQEREDGWLEMELGEFFNREGEDGELEISISEVNGGDWKGGLIVQGNCLID
ncbi:hypothetical protein GH714_026654 [Hevea brasiliensis]|uniref:F-box domain-containing protein n=1 Tax=Hevea brasiliensis TaxID=3981 RepID=A0A6A6M425_HEVBR|nr:hypothetical protein GH714_026654 [Hevea brasiliensis]